MQKPTAALRKIMGLNRIPGTSKWRMGSFLAFFLSLCHYIPFIKFFCYSFFLGGGGRGMRGTLPKQFAHYHKTRCCTELTGSACNQAVRTLYTLHTVIDFRWSTAAGVVWVVHRATADGEMAGNNPEHCHDKEESHLPSLHRTPI
jgi:hypothetical protein